MTPSTPLPVILLVQLPLLAIWLYVLWDIARSELPVMRKALWALACSLLWPMQVVYLLAGPQWGRAERVQTHPRRHTRLVAEVLDLEAGRISREQFHATVAELAHHRGSRWPRA